MERLLFWCLFSGLYHISPYLKYIIYKDTIIKEYCENKDQPELKCDGKCHLKKEIIKKEKEKPNNNNKSPKPQPKKQLNYKTQFCDLLLDLQLNNSIKYSLKNSYYYNATLYQVNSDIELPPPEIS